MILPLFQALRPHQWTKNLLVFAPLVFKHRLNDRESVVAAGICFVVFCALASGTYLVNDILDRQEDSLHPKKQHRPVASGRLPVRVAAAAGVLLWMAAMGGAAMIGPADAPLPFLTWPAAYLLLNLAYSTALKKIALVDTMCIAVGFMIRVHAGAAVLPGRVESSSWLLLCTFFFALLLAFCKRREEMAGLGSAAGTRESLRGYDIAWFDHVIPALAALSILSYALWTASERTVSEHGTRNLILTVPVVAYGVFRYLLLAIGRRQGDDPARTLFTDRGLLAAGAVYLLLLALLLS